ncbi:dihydrofolate reductase [Salinispirillum marinum]|uniref:Dihydrofolate reductase n=2 Tax=Saccharospirillaceae TaxID=255527 RepID=A0ABV8BCH5_9GAMM
MQKALIWAQAANGVIGRNNALPWYLPNDLKFFKAMTFGKPVIMGRKTFDSIGRPLPGRTNIVLSRQPDALPAGVIGVTTLADAYAQAEAKALIDGQDEIIVMGGAQLYALALPDADRLYITHVHADVEGDAWAPEVDWSQFTERQREDFTAEGPNPYPYSFVLYERDSGA